MAGLNTTATTTSKKTKQPRAKDVMKNLSDHEQPDARVDEQELGKLGYAQELFRTMGGFSNFAISFSIISILTGAVTLYGHGLKMGGPAEMAFGWPLVTLFTLAV